MAELRSPPGMRGECQHSASTQAESQVGRGLEQTPVRRRPTGAGVCLKRCSTSLIGNAHQSHREMAPHTR